MLEKDIQNQILSYLKIKNIFHYKSNNVGIYKKSTGSYIPSGVLGLPDIICVIKGQYIGIEVKKQGGKQSEHQKQFQKSLEEAGGKYILAHNLEDVLKFIN